MLEWRVLDVATNRIATPSTEHLHDEERQEPCQELGASTVRAVPGQYAGPSRGLLLGRLMPS